MLTYFKKLVSGLLMVTMGVALAADKTESRSFTLGAYDISWQTAVSQSGDASVRVRYTPYERYLHGAWAQSRYHTPGAEPLGARAYWDLPVPQILSFWHGNEDLATQRDFTMELSTRTASGWSRLALADALVREFLIRYPLHEFLSEYTTALRVRARKLEKELGKPIAFFDYVRSPLAKRDQYVLMEALGSLDEASSFFSPEFDEALTSLEAATKLPPRLPKLSRTPSPLSAHPLLVVHATTQFDAGRAAAPGIDRAIHYFQSRQLPMVFLMNDAGDGDLGWYTQSRSPTFAVFSDGGEHNLDLRADDVTITGGFFGDTDGSHGCHFKAVLDSISRYFLNGKGPLRVHLPMDAIYYYGDDEGMVSDFLQGRTTAPEFLKQVAELLFFAEDEATFGTGSAATGVLSTKDYTFDFLWDGDRVYRRGDGPRRVELRFTRSVETKNRS